MPAVTDPEKQRQNLLQTAAEYASALQRRPQVRGILVYGSLSSGSIEDLTEFSDIDLAVFVEEPLPRQFAEHRVFQGAKVDVLYFSTAALERTVRNPPYSLWQDGWLFHYLYKALVLGGKDAVLYDPEGAIQFARERITGGKPASEAYRRLMLPPASEWFHRGAERAREAADRDLASGNFSAAGETACNAIRPWIAVIHSFANQKDLSAAAESLGVDYSALAFLAELAAADPAAVERHWQCVQRVIATSRENGFAKVYRRLEEQGVRDPRGLELTGDYPLFWPGTRLHELGRVEKELDVSLQWSRDQLNRGEADRGLGTLWACSRAETWRQRWTGLADGISDAGYDVREIVKALLDDPGFCELLHELDESHGAAATLARTNWTETDAREGVDAARRVGAQLEKAAPWLSTIERHRLAVVNARDSQQLADGLAGLEEALPQEACEREFESLRRRQVSDSACVLRTWRLTPEAGASPAGEHSLPEFAVWKWRDPQGTDQVFREEPSVVEMLLKAQRVFGSHKFSWPQLLTGCDGAFTLQASVSDTGGIVAWKGDTALFLERHARPGEVRFCRVPSAAAEAEVLGRGSLASPSIWLRLQREGDHFRAACSADGLTWYGCGEADLSGPGSVTTGFFGYCYFGYLGREALRLRIADVKLWRQG